MFKNYNFYFTSDPIWFAGVLTRASAILLPWVLKLDQQNQEIGQIFALVFKSNLNQKLKKKRCKLDLVLIKLFGCDYKNAFEKAFFTRIFDGKRHYPAVGATILTN